MSNNISQVNYNANQGISLVQRDWQYNPIACGRPAADLDLPIFCSTAGATNSTWIVNEGVDFMIYQRCCPLSSQKTNLYTTQYGCGRGFCYTSDEIIAKGWSKCIRDAAVQAAAEARKNGTLHPDYEDEPREPDAVVMQQTGKDCQYIDYDMLKKGVLKDGEIGKEGRAGQNTWSVKIMMGMVGLSFLLVSIGGEII